MGTKPGTLEVAYAYLERELADVQRSESLTVCGLAARTIVQSSPVSPVRLLALAAAIVQTIRLDAQRWITTAVDYDEHDADEVVDTVLDQVEDAGREAAELLAQAMAEDPTYIAVTEDGQIHLTNEAGELLCGFEVVLTNAPGSEETN